MSRSKGSRSRAGTGKKATARKSPADTRRAAARAFSPPASSERQPEDGRRRRPFPSSSPTTGAELVETYGDDLEEKSLSEAEQAELLLIIWQMMQGFVDLAYAVGPGDKFTPESAIGMDDVLQYLCLGEMAHDAEPPGKPPTKKKT